MPVSPQLNLPVKDILNRLGREEQALKRAGAYAEAAGIRDAVVVILKLADESPPDADERKVPILTECQLAFHRGTRANEVFMVPPPLEPSE